MGLAIILLSNVLLVLVNSSNINFAFQTFIELIIDKVMWAVTGGTILGLMVIIYTPLSNILSLTALSAGPALYCCRYFIFSCHMV